MGFTPQQVNDMSMWQFFAALNGYIEANKPKGSEKLSESEKDYLFSRLDVGDVVAGTLRTQTYWLDGDKLVPWRVVEFEAA
jgi:hypothetical protein